MTAPISHPKPAEGHTPTPWGLSPTSGFYVLRDDICLATCGIGNWMPEVEKANAAFIVEAVNSHASLKARNEELEEHARFLLDRLEEFDPGDDEPKREFHGHVTPAIARLRTILQSKGVA